MHFNDEVTPATILAELVRYAEAQPDDTQGFRHLKHGDLYPHFYAKAEQVLAAFDKYRSITYNTLSAGDRGTDIVIRYSCKTISDGKERHIAIQIKSFDEFENDDDLFSKISARIYNSEKAYETALERYYLLLCTDQGKHLERVRAICTELKENPKVVVVEPRNAWFFFAMEDAMIDAVSDSLMYPEDYVRRQAREQVAGIGKRRLILLLSCLIHAIEEKGCFTVSDDFVMHNDHVQEFEKNNPEDHASLSEDVVAMEGRFFFREADVAGFEIYQDSVSAIVALYYDAKVRYGHTGDEAVHYLSTFLEQSA
ncbi:hypothetical protein [Nitrosovibrio sp. Nv4]|uniref:hypothetical protein n=1 Tax=Nitrosovibrio sp. Nv4 TaxID=1945880 RepID=UPI000BDAC05E|nr:hypothetical protein [Nitrosovibrio sp. Nv4]SOD40010.1 hypothetical protein SAMN06298226_0246 [Nitrosovibrio sp. Nv4]